MKGRRASDVPHLTASWMLTKHELICSKSIVPIERNRRCEFLTETRLFYLATSCSRCLTECLTDRIVQRFLRVQQKHPEESSSGKNKQDKFNYNRLCYFLSLIGLLCIEIPRGVKGLTLCTKASVFPRAATVSVRTKAHARLRDRGDQERARKARSGPVSPGAHQGKRCANCVEAKYQHASYFTVPYQMPPTHHSEQIVVGKCIFKHGLSYWTILLAQSRDS